MRRNYISNEYIYSNIPGSFNMLEESNYFGAKMLEIEDALYISNQNLIYYQQPNGEQFDMSIESTLLSNIYSSSDNKLKNHTINIDNTQTITQKNSNTKWIIEINLKNILSDYLFAVLKKYRTFEGIKTNMTLTNDVNSSIKNYINSNIINRYKYSKIDFYIKYNNLVINNINLRFNNIWDSNISTDLNRKVQTIISPDNTSLKVLFTQEKPSTEFIFQYYINISFEKI